MAKSTLGAAASEALTQVRALSRTTADLVKAQLSQDGTRLGAGVALLGGALVTALGVVPLLVLAIVWGLIALGVWPWAAYLITAGVVLVAAAGLAAAGRSLLKRAAASIGRTTAMVKDSLDALKGEADGPRPDGQEPRSKSGTEN
ncbi:MAG: phage holin family protein [Bifidobacteriaceae bacterium]|jgi:hypothetical protein|nr:phage holin family protein [Bifidobacteriaceae bacterium]